jgi:hypothetical protein
MDSKIMHCKRAALALLAMVVVQVVMGTSPAMAKEGVGPEFAGTYLWLAESGFQQIVTITKDGTFTIVSHRASVDGFSVGLGTAKRTGRREVTARKIDFGFDPDGIPNSITSVVYTMIFSDKRRGKYHSILGSQMGEVFSPEQNPLNPTEPPFATFSSTFKASA